MVYQVKFNIDVARLKLEMVKTHRFMLSRFGRLSQSIFRCEPGYHYSSEV